MADHSNQGGTDLIATDELSTMNGAAATGNPKAQRVKVGYGVDGDFRDASLSFPFPVREVEPSPLYVLTVPPQAVGANKVMVDLFNATGSGKKIRIVSALAYPNLDTAVTGTVGVRLSLTRTTAVGTGGTGAAADGADPTLGTVTALDPASAALPAQVTARVAPTGGATGGAVLKSRQTFTEETNAGSAVAAAVGLQYINVEAERGIIIPENTGARFVQGTVAGVGSVGFEIVFALDA